MRKTMSELMSDIENMIAIVGMGCKLPMANDLTTFWENLLEGVEAVQFFTDKELIAKGINEDLLKQKNFVKAAVQLQDKEYFDAEFFGISPREAELMDPQQRILLECAYQTIEHAGYSPEQYPADVGVFLGADASSYFIHQIINHPELMQTTDQAQLIYTNSSAATQISYRLGLTGPSMDINTACSTSLVAIHAACRSLLFYECDAALAGGASINASSELGYLYKKDSILSPDGHCRAFDEQAAGTVPGQGVALVLLKRLSDALNDGDTIYSVIRGTAINNDGAKKIGYTAPSIEGQIAVLNKAIALADVDPETVRYIECHGTGTLLGDPIELTALKEAYRPGAGPHSLCYLGSLKTNLGHLNSAAGVAGLIKTVLTLYHKKIPASLHFKILTKKVSLQESGLRVNAQLQHWQQETNLPRRAGVSSFGIGGTNAHVILEEYCNKKALTHKKSFFLLTLSAKTKTALEKKRRDFKRFLENSDEALLESIIYTANVGRTAFPYRCALVAKNKQDLMHLLSLTEFEYKYCKAQREIENELMQLSEGDEFEFLSHLSERWQEGMKIDWKKFYKNADNYQRVAIPTYPFERKYFWLSDKKQIHSERNKSIYQAPEQPIEIAIAAIWSEILGVDNIGLKDNFFDLGGHSLLAIQINARLSEELGLQLSLFDLLNNPTIEGTLEAILKQQLSEMTAADVESILNKT